MCSLASLVCAGADLQRDSSLRWRSAQNDIYEQASVKSEEDRKRIFPNIYSASSLRDAPHNTVRAGPIH